MEADEAAISRELLKSPLTTLLVVDYFLSCGAVSLASEIWRLVGQRSDRLMGFEARTVYLRWGAMNVKQYFDNKEHRIRGIDDDLITTLDNICIEQKKETINRAHFQKMLMEVLASRLLFFFASDPYDLDGFDKEYTDMFKTKIPPHPLASRLTTDSKSRLQAELRPLRSDNIDPDYVTSLLKKHSNAASEAVDAAIAPILSALGPSELAELVLDNQDRLSTLSQSTSAEHNEAGYVTSSEESGIEDTSRHFRHGSRTNRSTHKTPSTSSRLPVLPSPAKHQAAPPFRSTPSRLGSHPTLGSRRKIRTHRPPLSSSEEISSDEEVYHRKSSKRPASARKRSSRKLPVFPDSESSGADSETSQRHRASQNGSRLHLTSNRMDISSSDREEEPQPTRNAKQSSSRRPPPSAPELRRPVPTETAFQPTAASIRKDPLDLDEDGYERVVFTSKAGTQTRPSTTTTSAPVTSSNYVRSVVSGVSSAAPVAPQDSNTAARPSDAAQDETRAIVATLSRFADVSSLQTRISKADSTNASSVLHTSSPTVTSNRTSGQRATTSRKGSRIVADDAVLDILEEKEPAAKRSKTREVGPGETEEEAMVRRRRAFDNGPLIDYAGGGGYSSNEDRRTANSYTTPMSSHAHRSNLAQGPTSYQPQFHPASSTTTTHSETSTSAARPLPFNMSYNRMRPMLSPSATDSTPVPAATSVAPIPLGDLGVSSYAVLPRATKPMKEKPPGIPFNSEENDFLTQEVLKYGHRWAQIAAEGAKLGKWNPHARRDNMSLKDRWRNIRRVQGLIPGNQPLPDYYGGPPQ